MKKIIRYWHSKLNMPKHNLNWHKQDMDDELKEFKEAEDLFNKWSELSDVVYTYTRALWSGHDNILFPFRKRYFYLGALYMFPKYTLRWKFFRILGKKFDQNIKITEVRNPKNHDKLREIALRYNLDPIKFTEEARKQERYWIFLK